KLHDLLGTLFSWLLRQRRVSINPCVGVWKPSASPARTRILSGDEIRLFWHCTDRLPVQHRAVLRALLVTGARLNEVNGMRHEELSADGIWTLPGARTKNPRPHSLPLPSLACDILASVPRVEGPFVFTTSGRHPTSGWSKCKKALDVFMAAAAKEEGGKEVPHWRIHDLRRTAASGMQRLGIRVEVIERVLNHRSGAYAGVVGTYQTDEMLEDKAPLDERDFVA